jgi:hypothetical protein
VDRGAVAYSPDGEVLAAAAPNHRIDLWHVRTGRRLATLQGPEQDFCRYLPEPMGGYGPTRVAPLIAGRPLKFSDDGRRLVALAMFGKRWRAYEHRYLDEGAEIRATVWDVARFAGSGQTTAEEPSSGDDDAPAASSGTAGGSPAGGDGAGPTISPHEAEAAEVVRLRTWTSADGRYRVRAELIRRDGENVALKTEDGRTIRVPIERLCGADQAYLHVVTKSRRE